MKMAALTPRKCRECHQRGVAQASIRRVPLVDLVDLARVKRESSRTEYLSCRVLFYMDRLGKRGRNVGVPMIPNGRRIAFRPPLTPRMDENEFISPTFIGCRVPLDADVSCRRDLGFGSIVRGGDGQRVKSQEVRSFESTGITLLRIIPFSGPFSNWMLLFTSLVYLPHSWPQRVYRFRMNSQQSRDIVQEELNRQNLTSVGESRVEHKFEQSQRSPLRFWVLLTPVVGMVTA
jgi:hypothetical protein